MVIYFETMSSSGASELSWESPGSSLESPHCSPATHPSLYTFAGNSGTVMGFKNNVDKPFLLITEQPQKHFRFRYDSEKSGSTHGCLLGRTCGDKKSSNKTYPSVKLMNYHGKAVIKCSIKFKNNVKELNDYYKVLEEEIETLSCQVPDKNSYEVGFRGIGVYIKKQSELATLLYARHSERYRNTQFDIKTLRAQCETASKRMEQKIIQLQFSAWDLDTNREICEPVLSDPVYSIKNVSTNVLNIVRMSVCGGRPTGDEDNFLLVDKIEKNDIEVHFFENDSDGNQKWFKKAKIEYVHNQCAIVCRIPPYRDPYTSGDVQVNIQLYRPSDGSTSQPKPFVYKANEIEKQIKKRKITRIYPAFQDSTLEIKDLFQENTQIKFSANETQRGIQNSKLTSFDEYNTYLNTSLHNFTNTFLNVSQSANTAEVVRESETNISPETTEADLIIQKKIEVYKTMECKTDDSQERSIEGIDVEGYGPVVLEGTVNPFGELELEPLSSLEDLVYPQGVNGLQDEKALGFDGTESIDTGYCPGVTGDESEQEQQQSPMWGSQINWSQQDTADVETSSLGGCFHRYVQDIFEAQGQTFKLTSDSGRVKDKERVNIESNQDESDDEFARAYRNTETMTSSEFKYSIGTENNESTDGTINDNITIIGNSTERVENEITEEVVCGMQRLNIGKEIKCKDRDSESKIDDDDDDKKELIQAKDSSKGINIETEVSALDKIDNVNPNAKLDIPVQSEVEYSARFSQEDAEEVEKLVCELAAILRNTKSCSASLVRDKLRRLFQIRLSNGDTFLHMAFFKNQQSFETLVEILHRVNMCHLLVMGNARGETVLHLVAGRGQPALVRRLLGCLLHRLSELERAAEHSDAYESAEDEFTDACEEIDLFEDAETIS